jgi:hypothetical protein
MCFDILKESLQTAACSKETELKTQLSDLMSTLKSIKEKLHLSEVGIKYVYPWKTRSSQALKVIQTRLGLAGLLIFIPLYV